MPKAGKSRRSLREVKEDSSVSKILLEERLAEAAGIVSLKSVSLEERRKEADKPLFLTRYE